MQSPFNAIQKPSLGQSVTAIDKAIRKDAALLRSSVTPSDRKAAAGRLEVLKERRLEMLKPKGYGRMLRALGAP